MCRASPLLKLGYGSCLDLRVAGKVIAAVCHGPAGMVDATGSDGKSVFNGKRVTGFCNTEEEAVGKTDKVPFLLEDRMKALGGKYEKKGDWNDFSITDGRLVTGDPSLLCCKNLINLRGICKDGIYCVGMSTFMHVAKMM